MMKLLTEAVKAKHRYMVIYLLRTKILRKNKHYLTPDGHTTDVLNEWYLTIFTKKFRH